MDLLKAYAADALGVSVEEIRAVYDFTDYVIVDTIDGKRRRLDPSSEPIEPPLIRWRVSDPENLVSEHVWELLNAHYEHADAVYDAPNDELIKIPGIGKATLKNIRALIGPPIEEPKGSDGNVDTGDSVTSENADTPEDNQTPQGNEGNTPADA